MNRTQNIDRKNKNKQIRELEIEVSLLRQKLEMISNIVGGSLNKPASLGDEKHSGVRAIATVWKADQDIYFQTNSDEDKEFLMKQIEIKKKKVAEMVGKEVEEQVKEDKRGDSIIDHMKR